MGCLLWGFWRKRTTIQWHWSVIQTQILTNADWSNYPMTTSHIYTGIILGMASANETILHFNVVSHWLSPYPEWSLIYHHKHLPRMSDKYNSIDQSHRYGRHQAACRKPAGSYDKTTRTAICFEHKTQYLLIRAPYTCIVVFGHISNITPMISQSQISCNTPTFYIATIFVKYCYTTGSWLL